MIMNSNIDKELDALQRKGEQIASARWFKFEKVGDSVQGTFISVSRQTSQLGQDQFIYVLKDGANTYNVARNISDKRVRRVMDYAKLGQIVRFVLTDIIPNKVKGFNAIKAVDVYTQPSLIDKVWLTENGLTEPAETGITPLEGNEDGPRGGGDETNKTESAANADIPQEA